MEDKATFLVSLDRIEGDLAALLLREDESIRFTLPLSLLPGDAGEWDILEIAIRRDVAATTEARKRVAERIERLRGRGKA